MLTKDRLEPATLGAVAPLVHERAAPNRSVVGGRAPNANEAGRHGIRVLLVLSVLMAFGSISTDLYLPAMPTMGRDRACRKPSALTVC